MAAAAWVAAEVSVVGGVLVLLASPTALLWAFLSRLLRRMRRSRSDAASEAASDSDDSPQADK